MVASTLGSSTRIFWKRRSSAASFSMYLRYSSSVVAPTQCSSPRASAGLSMLPASMAPSALPAPTMVCSSSMKTMVWPSSLASSFSTVFRRSSNSPRYLAPASSAAMSSDSTRLPLSDSGTSPATMRWARPSTMAVLPTPGSPISTGLFLVRRCSTWIARRISSSRPITGSSLPWRARSVRSMQYFLRASRWPSASALSTLRSAAHGIDRRFQRLARQPVLAGDAADVLLGVGQGQQEELAGDELVAALERLLLGGLHQRHQVAADLDLFLALDLPAACAWRPRPRPAGPAR